MKKSANNNIKIYTVEGDEEIVITKNNKGLIESIDRYKNVRVEVGYGIIEITYANNDIIAYSLGSIIEFHFN